MSLMAIILWALYPLSPWRRYYEIARLLLGRLLDHLSDEHQVAQLCANPDDRRGISFYERILDDLNTVIGLLIHVRARQILGLSLGAYRFRRSPPQRARSRNAGEFLARLEACALRFADIERLAQRRAQKLTRLLA